LCYKFDQHISTYVFRTKRHCILSKITSFGSGIVKMWTVKHSGLVVLGPPCSFLNRNTMSGPQSQTDLHMLISYSFLLNRTISRTRRNYSAAVHHAHEQVRKQPSVYFRSSLRKSRHNVARTKITSCGKVGPKALRKKEETCAKYNGLRLSL